MQTSHDASASCKAEPVACLFPSFLIDYREKGESQAKMEAAEHRSYVSFVATSPTCLKQKQQNLISLPLCCWMDLPVWTTSRKSQEKVKIIYETIWDSTTVHILWVTVVLLLVFSFSTYGQKNRETKMNNAFQIMLKCVKAPSRKTSTKAVAEACASVMALAFLLPLCGVKWQAVSGTCKCRILLTNACLHQTRCIPSPLLF